MAKIDYAKLTTIIESEFKDRVTAYNYQTKKNVDGTTSTERVLIPKFENIPCKLSFLNYESPNSSEVDTNLILLNPKIFFSLGINIEAGDYLEVLCKGADGNTIGTYKGVAGLPNVYITHKEVLFSMKDNA